MTRGGLKLEQVLGVEEAGAEVSPEAQDLEAALLALHGQATDRPPAGLWDRIETRIGRDAAAPGTRTVVADEGVWERIAPGIDRKVVYVDRETGTQSYFVRMRKGAILPGHEHGASEHCVVLEGSLEIGGAVFGKGTYHFAQEGFPHGSIAARSDAQFFIQGAL